MQRDWRLTFMFLFPILSACSGMSSQPAGNVPVENRSATGVPAAGLPERPAAATQSPVPVTRAGQPVPVTPPVRTTPTTASDRPPAVVTLMEQARKNLQVGKPDMAAAELERALRMQPRDPGLWSLLAEVRLSQGDWQQAEVLARKSLSLAGGETGLDARNRMIIDRARQRRPDLP